MAVAKVELRSTGARAVLQALKSPSPLTLRVCLPTVMFSCMLRGEQGSRIGAEKTEWFLLLLLLQCVCVVSVCVCGCVCVVCVCVCCVCVCEGEHVRVCACVCVERQPYSTARGEASVLEQNDHFIQSVMSVE